MKKNQETINAIIFDMGRVLVDIDNDFLVKELFKGLHAANVQELGRKTMSDPAMVEFNTGCMDARTFHARMHDSYGVEPNFELFKQRWCQIFRTMNGMEELVSSITPNINVGLLSDTDPIHWEYLRTTWPWIGAISNPTLSYELGVMKPNPAIYRTAATNVKTAPQHCLFIDDLQANVDGAKAIDMQAIRFEGVSQLANRLREWNLIM